MIEIDDQISRPLNLAHSEVLRAVEEEEQMKCEPVKCERQSRARQHIYQRTHTPVHQQQLEQIKTQYLSHQHDITIDRDTVLKINRLATRRNLHKREHSWPPTIKENSFTTSTHEQFNNAEKNKKSSQQTQHVRSTSIDNALQFDETVCKRHGIDVIRKKFNSPTRIIEPTAQEVRQKREQQRRLQQKQQKVLQQHQQQQCKTKGGSDVDSCEAGHAVTTNKPKQMINLLKHEELLRKNSANKSTAMTDTAIAQKANEKSDFSKIISIPVQQSAVMSTEMNGDKKSVDKMVGEDELFISTTAPTTKGFSHPETKAADEDIGLVEPKRQYYEHLSSTQKWHSSENLNAVPNIKASAKPLLQPKHKRQAYSLERGREARQQKQLPPQKPRSSPKLQRRCMKLATEVKIVYDNDVQQHNTPDKFLSHTKELNPRSTSTTRQDDLEHIPLPAIPSNLKNVPLNVEPGDKQECQFDSDVNKNFVLKDQQIYDDSCIFLRSVDLQDNTVAYIPAAITIVPSPTEEIIQHWMESSSLKAHIKGVNDIEKMEAIATKACHELQNKKENSISHISHEAVKPPTIPEGIKHQPSEKQQQQRNDKQNSEAGTYVTRLPSTPNGIQLTRQVNANAKLKTQTNNNNQDSGNNSNLTLTGKAATNEHTQQTTEPEVKYSNATLAECNEVAKESNKFQQPGIYYTDGEYLYGPYDQDTATLLPNATVRSLQAEQQEKHQQLQEKTEIKKYIEAETKSQHKTEIANLTAKYENIQKSINEHLKQIDTYIGNAKAALKSAIPTDNSPESFQQPLASLHALYSHPQCSLKAQLDQTQQEKTEIETPLKEILRKINSLMQDVKPLYRNQKAKEETCLPPPACKVTQQDKEENMPIVDKVLMDLNMLTKQLSEFDKNSGEELKPIMEQLDFQFETRPTASTVSYVLINEETVNNRTLMETGKNHQKSETAKPTPPIPPPLPALKTTTPAPMALKQPMQEKRIQHDADKQLLATDKLITSQQHTQQTIKETATMSPPVPKDKDTTTTTAATTNTIAKDKNKNYVFDFITARHEQEQLVEQVIDTLGKLENESKEKLVNKHVPAHDDQIKSNLNQQTPSSETTTLTNNMEKDVVIMQNCNISASPNASGEDTTTCNHDNILKSTKGNESQLKLHIKDFIDKKAVKQLQKYDTAPTQNTNDVVNDNKNNKQNHECNEHVSAHHDHDDEDNKNIKMKITEEEGSSNHSSGSELSNTNKSSYELPSPYITMRQISWEDVLSSAPSQTTANLMQIQQECEKKAATTKSVHDVEPKHKIEIAQVCAKTPVILDKNEPTALTLAAMKPLMTSGHVGLQSSTTSKPRIQTRQRLPQQEIKQNHQHIQQHCAHTPDEGRKYPVSLIQPHLPTRATSPFGLNAIEFPLKQRSSSVSPTRIRILRTAEDTTSAATTANARHDLMQAIRKYPSPLAEPHLPKRDTSPYGLNTDEVRNIKHSPSTSPKRTKTTQRTSPATVNEMTIRKYPAPLAEPHVIPRAASPFGMNPVDVFHMTRATTPHPAYEMEVQHEQDRCDEHVHKPESPIRKYPPSLIEPHVPKRAASPFGLNAVDTIQTAHRRTPSPIRSPLSLHQHHHHHRHHQLFETNFFKSTSTSGDSLKKTVVYVPQVEGHNIGLLVRTSSPTPYCHTDVSHASSIYNEEMINATYTTQDYATATTTDIASNNYSAASDIGRDGEDDDAPSPCDELQRINTIGLTKQVKQPKMHILNSTGTTATNKAMPNHLHQQHQPQKHEQQQQFDEPHLQNQEQYSRGSGQHMAVDTITLPTSIINRSFDNVSPRPYISIEGYKRVAWPPASEERIVREFTPQPQTQYQPAPAYNQQHQPSAAAAASAVPPTQEPIYNNTQHNTNNFARDSSPPLKPNPNPSEYEAFPPLTPETPIILKDKQFSRLPSQEPTPANTASYQQYQQPQNQSMQQPQTQQNYQQEQFQFKQPLYSQQNYQQQQHQYQSNQQSVSHTHHHHQHEQQMQQYQMPEEHHPAGWKPIRPPQTKPGHLFSGHNGVRENTQSSPLPTLQQSQYETYQQPSANHQPQYRAPSYDNYKPQYQQPPQQQQQPQQQQYPPQPQYQAQAPQNQVSQNIYQQPPQAGSYSQQPAQQPAWAQQPQSIQQQPQQQYQQPPWVQQPQQQQQQYPQQQQPQYQNPLNQYNQAPHHQQQQQLQYPLQQNQFVPQTNQQQFNSYSQPQQQQHTVSHDQVDQQQHHQPHLSQDQRGASPGIITLRKEAPVTQKPAPVYSSQPAAISFRGGSNMRGDLKWPPPEYKEAAVKENEERRKLALGPVCRPRKINRDYTSFFAKNALSHHYPSYKVPPGTQHMIN